MNVPGTFLWVGGLAISPEIHTRRLPNSWGAQQPRRKAFWGEFRQAPVCRSIWIFVEREVAVKKKKPAIQASDSGFGVGLVADHYSFAGDDAFEAAGVGAVNYRDDGNQVHVAQGHVEGEIGIEIGESLFGENGL